MIKFTQFYFLKKKNNIRKTPNMTSLSDVLRKRLWAYLLQQRLSLCVGVSSPLLSKE